MMNGISRQTSTLPCLRPREGDKCGAALWGTLSWCQFQSKGERCCQALLRALLYQQNLLKALWGGIPGFILTLSRAPARPFFHTFSVGARQHGSPPLTRCSKSISTVRTSVLMLSSTGEESAFYSGGIKEGHTRRNQYPVAFSPANNTSFTKSSWFSPEGSSVEFDSLPFLTTYWKSSSPALRP